MEIYNQTHDLWTRTCYVSVQLFSCPTLVRPVKTMTLKSFSRWFTIALYVTVFTSGLQTRRDNPTSSFTFRALFCWNRAQMQAKPPGANTDGRDQQDFAILVTAGIGAKKQAQPGVPWKGGRVQWARSGQWTRAGGGSRGQWQKAAVNMDAFQQPSQEVSETLTSCLIPISKNVIRPIYSACSHSPVIVLLYDRVAY